MWPWVYIVDLAIHMYSNTLVDFTHFSSFGGHTAVYGRFMAVYTGLWWTDLVYPNKMGQELSIPLFGIIFGLIFAKID